MRKITLILIAISLLLVLSSCNIADGSSSEKITTPKNNTPPIQGKWVIDEVVLSPYSQSSGDSVETMIGREGLFHKEGVVVGDDFTIKPSFKIKNVNAIDYLLYKYKINAGKLGIDEDMIEVITILNDNTYFYEFIKTSDDFMLVNINDTFYSMKKTVDEVNIEEINRYVTVEKSMLRTFGVVEEENFQSGVLLGIKTPAFDEKNQAPFWEYKTIWINSQNKSIAGVYELNKLLVPRKNGFWILGNERQVSNNYISDELIATPLFRPNDISSIEDDINILLAEEEISLVEDLPSIIKNILFIGNDYISVENIDLDRNSRRTLQVYAIDNLEDKKPIKLSDLIGKVGADIFEEGVRSVQSLDPSIIPNEENVGLVRRNGYWIMKGRINYNQNDEELYKDFNIKSIPPKEMVNYDEQKIPWDAIRLMIPDVEDVFSSPNNDFIVVITSSHFVIYNLEDGDLINNPVARIKLPYDSSIIMSEWAIDRYANIWQNEVIKNGGTLLEY
jgi:hypothetical protein